MPHPKVFVGHTYVYYTWPLSWSINVSVVLMSSWMKIELNVIVYTTQVYGLCKKMLKDGKSLKTRQVEIALRMKEYWNF